MSNIRQEILEAIKGINIYSRPAAHLIELPIINNGANDVVAFDLLAGKKTVLFIGLSGNSYTEISNLNDLVISGVNDTDNLIINATKDNALLLFSYLNVDISLTGVGSTIQYTAGQLDKFYAIYID